MNRALARRRARLWGRYADRWPSYRVEIGLAWLRWDQRAERPARRWVR